VKRLHPAPNAPRPAEVAEERFLLLQWRNYGRARAWADVVFVGIAWFVVVEVAA
jgi:hypothetical protein